MHAHHNPLGALARRAQLRGMAMDTAAKTSGAIHLDPMQVAEIADLLTDAIVERVVDALRAEVGIPQGHASMSWLDAKAVAELLGVERGWVYEHADELGASRIGSGSRPRLRFPPDLLDRQSKAPARREANTKSAIKPKGLIPIHSQ